MRGRQALKNILASLLLQLITAASGFILPRFYLLAYGSAMNGMISSVSQFMSYLMLVEAGVGSACAVALYGPLSRRDTEGVNKILAASSQFYRRSGVLYLFLVLMLTAGYPFLVADQAPMEVTRAIVLILSLSNLVDYFFLGKYRILLNADQHGYVVTLTQCLGTVANLALSLFLIRQGWGLVLVRGAATAVYVMRSFLIYGYIRRRYPYVDLSAEPDKEPLKQKWAVLFHQVVNIVVNNTDLVLLTLFLQTGSLLEVSVYSVYNMVAYHIASIVSSFSGSLSSGFGQLFAIREEETLRRAFDTYEYLYDMVLFLCYTCMACLLAPFIQIYTRGIQDVRYLRLELVLLFPLIGLLQNIRIPGLTMICAAGHYEETKGRAALEAVINLAVSIALVRPLGIVGVLLGTLASYGYRTFDVLLYNSRYLVKGALRRSLRRLLQNGLAAALSMAVWYGCFKTAGDWSGYGYGSWLAGAALCGCISAGTLAAVNGAAEPAQMRAAFGRAWQILRKPPRAR